MKSNALWFTMRTGGWCGIISLLLFFGIAVGAEQLFWQSLDMQTARQFLEYHGQSPYYQISIYGHLLIGFAMLFMIISFLGLKTYLETEKNWLWIKSATIFGVLACVIMVLQCTVQGTVMVKMGSYFLRFDDEIQQNIILRIYWSLRQIDQGIDLAFDMFFFTAWILLAIYMWKSPGFGRVFSILGIGLFGAATIINGITAPIPPSFEISPFVSLWILAVMIQMIRIGNKLKKENLHKMMSMEG